MKERVSPTLAGAVIVIVLVVASLIGYRMLAGSAAASGEKPPGMPAEAQAEFQKRLGSASPTSSGAKQGVPGAPPGAPGTGAGYMAPPTPGR